MSGGGALHAGEAPVPPSLVRALVTAQLPHPAHLPLRPATRHGTDFHIWRQGAALVLRFPRLPGAEAALLNTGPPLAAMAERVLAAVLEDGPDGAEG